MTTNMDYRNRNKVCLLFLHQFDSDKSFYLRDNLTHKVSICHLMILRIAPKFKQHKSHLKILF